MTVIDNRSKSQFITRLEAAPSRLYDSVYGGLEAAREKHIHGDSVESFFRDLYGESYEMRHVCEAVHRMARDVRDAREEVLVEGVYHARPIISVDEFRTPYIDHDSTRALYEKPVTDFGNTVLFYGDWMCLGLKPRLEAREVTLPNAAQSTVMIAVLPGEPDMQDVVDGRVAIVPNPLRFIPTEEDIESIRVASGHVLDDTLRANGVRLY